MYKKVIIIISAIIVSVIAGLSYFFVTRELEEDYDFIDEI